MDKPERGDNSDTPHDDGEEPVEGDGRDGRERTNGDLAEPISARKIDA